MEDGMTARQEVSDRPSYGNGASQDGGLLGLRAAAERAQRKASSAADRMAKRATRAVSETKHGLADRVASVARALEAAAHQLRDDGLPGLARQLRRGADRVQHARDYLDTSSASELLDDLESSARRRPAWYLGGAFAAGVLCARFFKSSVTDAGGGDGAP
jgi:hypothetical protein